MANAMGRPPGRPGISDDPQVRRPTGLPPQTIHPFEQEGRWFFYACINNRKKDRGRRGIRSSMKIDNL